MRVVVVIFFVVVGLAGNSRADELSDTSSQSKFAREYFEQLIPSVFQEFQVVLRGSAGEFVHRELSMGISSDPESSGSLVCQTDGGEMPACLMLILNDDSV